MPNVPKGPLSKQEQVQVSRYLSERLTYPVSLDVWTKRESGILRTDRDPATHSDEVLATMRQVATLHGAISVTPYDLDRHGDRAEQAGVDRAPTTIVRGSGRSVRLVGHFTGLLFPAFLDVLWFVSNGVSPLQDETRAGLRELSQRVQVEAMVVPYDGFSAHMTRLLAAFAVESRMVRVQVTEMAEFPILAAQRSLEQVPAMTIEGRRYIGAWEEPALLEQIRRVIDGNDEVVVRDRILAAPYYTEEQLKQLAAEQQGAEQEAHRLAGDPAEDLPTPGLGGDEPPSSGLYVPGRD